MSDEKFSIVVPTMWKYAPFVEFLKDLVKFPLVDEIIIINNDQENTPVDDIFEHEKIKLVSFGRNIYVNPAWNFGVGVSRNNKICILNDDVIFDVKLFYRINEMDLSSTGVIGISPGNAEHRQPPFVNGSINIVPWQGENTLGFGCLMFIHKDWWIDIPTELKIYYGDNWIFETCMWRGQTNYLITDMLHYTPYAQTSSSVGIDFLNKECELYYPMLEDFKKRILGAAHLLTEYHNACKTSSNINEHLPTLNALAKECGHVTEFGVSDGHSTRAFLIEKDIKLRSYDIIHNQNVQSLFDVAINENRDFRYTIADVSTIEIEETDLLFIDTWHSYNQLKKELAMHSHKARKYIVMHDTHTFGIQDEGGSGNKGLLPAIIEFIIEHPEWKFKSHYTNCNGLTVLERTR
jgi:glycosyltransferase involved in cell wall biosynthesis